MPARLLDPIDSLEHAAAALGRAGEALNSGNPKQAGLELKTASVALTSVAAGLADAHTVLRLHARLLMKFATSLRRLIQPSQAQRQSVGG